MPRYLQYPFITVVVVVVVVVAVSKFIHLFYSLYAYCLQLRCTTQAGSGINNLVANDS
jgi:hypothetical protein